MNQVVHNYGDLCQSVSDLAVEHGTPFTTNEFRTLNRCLDDAIAGAVTEYARQRDLVVEEGNQVAATEHLGFLAHEMR
ncbi:MAG: sensor histidine kinase, partial [Betaproteobacteria bacterium]